MPRILVPTEKTMAAYLHWERQEIPWSKPRIAGSPLISEAVENFVKCFAFVMFRMPAEMVDASHYSNRMRRRLNALLRISSSIYNLSLK